MTFECQLTKGTRVTQAWAPLHLADRSYTGLTPATLHVLSVRGTGRGREPLRLVMTRNRGSS